MVKNRINTLIVEDSPVILENLTSALEEMTPVKVIGVAVDEKDALAKIAAHSFECDLIILDIFLKSGTGLGVLQGISQMAFQGECVVLTNYATPEIKKRCRELGAARTFDKSKDLDDLIEYCADFFQRNSK